jgi:limonene-1,2-epoxide hydrolase
MGIEQEAAVRSFILEFEGKRLDAAQVDRIVSRMTPNARYHVFAWEQPLVGQDAIRAELLRQAEFYGDARFDILTMASSGQTVFVERRDSCTMNGKQVAFHVVGVFQVDADGKIAAWRDYLDSKEIAVKLGPPKAAS